MKSMPKAATTGEILSIQKNIFCKSAKSVSKCHIWIWEKKFCTASERPPSWKFYYFYPKSVKSMPKTVTTCLFFYQSFKLLCKSVKSVSKCHICIWRRKNILNPCERPPRWNFCTFIWSPWSQCLKRRPHVFFLPIFDFFL